MRHSHGEQQKYGENSRSRALNVKLRGERWWAIGVRLRDEKFKFISSISLSKHLENHFFFLVLVPIWCWFSPYLRVSIRRSCLMLNGDYIAQDGGEFGCGGREKLSFTAFCVFIFDFYFYVRFTLYADIASSREQTTHTVPALIVLGSLL